MGRIIGFIGVKSSVGSTTLCFELAKNISQQNYKVCVIDFYFAINDLSQKFRSESKFDLKDFLIGKIGIDGILERDENNLYYIKTNKPYFDYNSYSDDIKGLINMLSYKFDYILIDVNSFDLKNVKLACTIIKEAYIIFDNEINSIKLIERKVKLIKQFASLDMINFVLNKSMIIGQLNKKYLTRLEIEELLNEDIIFEIPKLFNYNNFNKKKSMNYKEKIMVRFSNSFITNKTLHLNYSKKYKGFFGKIKRRFYARFE